MTALEKRIEKDYGNTAGIVVRKDGRVQYEKYFQECDADSRIHIYSVTKSILSILIGIARDQGYIKSVDQKVLDFFPGYKMCIRDRCKLLTYVKKHNWRPSVTAAYLGWPHSRIQNIKSKEHFYELKVIPEKAALIGATISIFLKPTREFSLSWSKASKVVVK